MSLPTPPDTFFKIKKTKLLDFLWGKNTPVKIAYCKLVQKYERLGLKLIDLETKDIALKAAWPTHWLDKDPAAYSWICTNLPIKDSRIWECNLAHADIKHLSLENPLSMCTSILRAWVQYTFKPVISDLHDILSSQLWGNSSIRQQNKPFLQKILVDTNIDTVLNIVHPSEKRFLTFNELFYYSIIAALPKLWKHEIKKEMLSEIIDQETQLETISKLKSPSKAIYEYILDKKFPVTNALKIIWKQTFIFLFLKRTGGLFFQLLDVMSNL